MSVQKGNVELEKWVMEAVDCSNLGRTKGFWYKRK